MIVDALFRFVVGFVATILNLAPSLPLPDWWDAEGTAPEGVTTIGRLSYEAGRELSKVHYWLPVEEMLETIPYVLTFALAVLTFRIVVWAYGMARGGGAS